MKIGKRTHGDIVILDIADKLTGTVSSGTGLSESILDLLADDDATPGRASLLLNFAACTGADSLGIGELISLHVSLSNRGGRLRLVHLPERILDLLRATQLISMFRVFDDEDEALASFE